MNNIVVTGAAGFIGSNLIQGLNARGIDDIIAVDDLSVGDKFRNLADLRIAEQAEPPRGHRTELTVAGLAFGGQRRAVVERAGDLNLREEVLVRRGKGLVLRHD